MSPNRAVLPEAGRALARWRRLIALALFVSMVLLMPSLLLLDGGRAGKLLEMFNRHARTEDSGIGAEEYPALAEALSGYLSGWRTDAQLMIIDGGEAAPAFKPHEVLHLKDVRSLFRLSETLALCAIAPTALAAGAVFRIRRYGRGKGLVALGKGGQAAALAAGGLLSIISLGTVMDFSAAFTLLHRLAFANDLWLLDPMEDLLLQLMPEPFFTEYAFRAALRILAALAVLFAAFTGLKYFGKRLAVEG